MLTASDAAAAAPGPGEVTVEVIAAGISHIDGFIRSGREETWEAEPFPAALGQRLRRDRGRLVRRRGSRVAPTSSGTSGPVRRHLPHRRRQPRWSRSRSGQLGDRRRAYLAGRDRARHRSTSFVSAPATPSSSRRRPAVSEHRGPARQPSRGDGDRHVRRAQLRLPPPAQDHAGQVRRGHRRPHPCGGAAGSDGVHRQLRAGRSRTRPRARRAGVALPLERPIAARRRAPAAPGRPESVAHGTEQLETLVELAGGAAFHLLISGYYPFDDVGPRLRRPRAAALPGQGRAGHAPVSTYRYLKARDVHDQRS